MTLPEKTGNNLRTWLILGAVVLVVALTALVKTLSAEKAAPPVEAPEVLLERYKASRTPVVVYFHSPECLSCNQVQGSLDEVYPEFKNRVALISLDVLEDVNDALVERTGVHTTPVLLFIDSSGNEQLFSGEISVADLRQKLSALGGGNP